ncbi:MAG: hypothetical protein ACOYVK_18400 [Bacillota bacterium]
MGVRKSYHDKYEVMKVFQTGLKQDIYIGRKKGKDEGFVIINFIKDGQVLSKSMKKSIMQSLSNLLHFEVMDDGILLVTNYLQGLNLHEYLESYGLEGNDRLHIIYQYLKHIVRYDGVSHRMKAILVDSSQLAFVNRELLFNELVIENSEAEDNIDFNHVVGKIANTLEILMNENSGESSNLQDLQHRYNGFFEGLKDNQHGYKCIEEIFYSFKGVYFGFSTEGRRSNGKGLSVAESTEKNSTKSVMLKSLAGSILIGILVYAGAGFWNDRVDPEIKSPTAYFEKVEMADRWEFVNKSTTEGKDNEIVESVWEVSKDQQVVLTDKARNLMLLPQKAGKYKIALKVMDKYNQWSNVYEEEMVLSEVSPLADISALATGTEVNTPEKLDDMNITLGDSSNVLFDPGRYRSGKYSIQCKPGEDYGQRSFSIKGIKLNPYPAMSLWVMYEGMDEINLHVEGYREQALQYDKLAAYKPTGALTWEMIDFGQLPEALDSMKITISGHSSSVWIDDIVFDSFK